MKSSTRNTTFCPAPICFAPSARCCAGRPAPSRNSESRLSRSPRCRYPSLSDSELSTIRSTLVPRSPIRVAPFGVSTIGGRRSLLGMRTYRDGRRQTPEPRAAGRAAAYRSRAFRSGSSAGPSRRRDQPSRSRWVQLAVNRGGRENEPRTSPPDHPAATRVRRRLKCGW